MSEIVELTGTETDQVKDSPLYSEDLAPVKSSHRTWNVWGITAIWVGMAVCIPTYLLASYMITAGLSWGMSLLIIGIANVIITLPMVLNGHAGMKYGVPFPVIGRAAFGTKGIHVPAIVRGLIACGWFGIQTWIGGLALDAIWQTIIGEPVTAGLTAAKFFWFGIFWLMNVYFIWQGTESIKWLEIFSAPILIVIGLVLIGWGANKAGGFGTVLDQSAQLQDKTAILRKAGDTWQVKTAPLKTGGTVKATHFEVTLWQTGSTGEPVPSNLLQKDTGSTNSFGWLPLNEAGTFNLATSIGEKTLPVPLTPATQVKVQFKGTAAGKEIRSSVVAASRPAQGSALGTIWTYLVWLTIMVGFWATMSISIADITRYAHSQKEQVAGQFMGLPGTMILYSFVGIFVTAAATINFEDILITEDAPWDPVSLLAKFEDPVVVIVAQIFMLIATLSTNIAANVIAPANTFSNAFPKALDFRKGGIVAAAIGIASCPWILLNQISGLLIFVSGALGPVVAILICDYFVLRNKEVKLVELYKPDGAYSYRGGFNSAAMISFAAGALLSVAGNWIPALEPLYKLSWFTGFIVSFFLYYILMKRSPTIA